MMTGDARLPQPARSAIMHEADLTFVSAANAWEITTKHRLGKLPSASELAADFEAVTRNASFEQLSISVAHASLAGKLEGTHRDPFDRMLIAQALLENLTLVSNETAFDRFGVSRLW
jgi:PIN domain nuclease of toxin-antitoxin system